MVLPPRPRHVRLLVVGAGPHALTVLSYLARYEAVDPTDVLVADRRDWLAAWRERFDAHEIPMLRSACVHHPDPDPCALLDFARDRGITGFHGPIGRPSSPLFDAFCDDLLDRRGLRGTRHPVGVRRLAGDPDGVDVTLDDGGVVHADDVLVANNPVRPDVPAWAVAEGVVAARGLERGGRVVLGHGDHVDLRRDCLPGMRVLVVGGGLTAAQLVLGAERRGAHVVLAHRGVVRRRDLDVEPTWLGRDLARLHRMPLADRPAQIAAARGGGSMPAHEARRIGRLARVGRIALRERTRLVDVRAHGDRWRVHLDAGDVHDVDAVWLATGQRPDPGRTLGSLARMLRAAPSERGLPCLGEDLALPGTRVRLTGALAALRTGPACRTIIGARIAAERMLPVFGVPNGPRAYGSWPS